MRPSVRTAWPAFCKLWENALPYLYLDTKRLATFGYGNMVESGGGSMGSYGLTRPWRDAAGNLVRESAIEAEYVRVHNREDLAPKGGTAYKDVGKLHLDDRDMVEALTDKTAEFWADLVKALPDLESWPADAQLALLNMAWNLGPGFVGSKWPNFTKAAKAGDFLACADDCLRAVKAPRDYRNRLLFLAAAWRHACDQDDRDGLFPVNVSAEMVAAATKYPSVATFTAYAVQVMLKRTGHYNTTLDGEFGPYSQKALAAYSKAEGVPVSALQNLLAHLSDDSGLRVPVGK